MDWMNQIGGLLQQSGGNQNEAAGSTPALAGVLANVFRSDQTPPFAQIAAQLFSQADGQQKASLLNTLLPIIGPALAGQFLQGGGASGLAGLLAGGQTQLTPEQANQVSPEAVQQMAAQAEQHDPGVVEQLSHTVAQNPDLLQSLGGALGGGNLGSLLSNLTGR